jgi:hypothetical protein
VDAMDATDLVMMDLADARDVADVGNGELGKHILYSCRIASDNTFFF